MNTGETERRISVGAEIHFRKDTENPLFAWETRAAMAAFTCGFDLISTKGFVHHVDGEAETVEAIAASRSVTWLWDLAKTVTFEPVKAETITVAEFFERFSDLEWCRKNHQHPIAFLRFYLDNTRDGLKKLGAVRPGLCFRRGDAKAVVPPDATPEDVDAYFAALDE